jgi:peptidoglycan/LPS O-acetylase OafA/YrhL
MKYRPEIDGLRALAVLPVILFHAGFELFSGGFVGVDVFFVISGYLITTILIEDIENKRFSIINFYERRARRILPALFFVMLVCIPFAWMWMFPDQLRDFSKSLVAVSLFVSNILFWSESGYFESAAEEKPLLHTWSLAVEEQYYVLFPIFLILAWRFGKNRVFWLIVVLAAISLLLSEWGWRNHPRANFFLAPTRAWELFAGSIAAFIVQRQGVQNNNLLAFAGLAAIIFSIFLYDETTPFPSVYALVPVLGVVLIVLYADRETVAARLLSTKGFVGIGLISYSAYLWHQPLFAFARLRLSSHTAEELMIALIIISFLVAYFSWKYVEAPFRSKNLSKRSIFIFSSVGLILFATLGGVFIATVKGPSEDVRLREGERDWKDCLNFGGTPRDDFVENPCVYSTIDIRTRWQDNVLLLGDSHAQVLHYDLASSSESQINYVLYAGGSCPPFVGDILSTACSDFHRASIDHGLRNLSVKAVVLSARWSAYVRSQTYKLSNAHLETRNPFGNQEESVAKSLQQVEHLIKIFLDENIPVIFVSDYPTNGINIRNAYLKSEKFDMVLGTEVELDRGDYNDWTQLVFGVLEKFISNDQFFVVNSYETVCGDTELCNLATKTQYLLNDTNHASLFGRTMMAKKISGVIDSLAQ